MGSAGNRWRSRTFSIRLAEEDGMASVSPRRYIMAFSRSEYGRPVKMFERLIGKLDRLG
jgi:hypothetical protein